MFSIKIEKRNGFEIYKLADETSGTYAEIIPECGAILHAFVVNNNGVPMNIVDSYTDLQDFKEHVTSKGFLGCKLSPFVCRIKNGEFHFGEGNHKIQKYYDKKNALHGMVYDRPFQVTEKSADDLKAAISMRYECRNDDAGYPFNYDCIVTYELLSENKLSVITEIVNKETGLIPVQDGWHPYFNLGDKIDDLQLEFQSKEMVEFDEELIPTGNLIKYEEFGSLKRFGDTVYDNCFTLNFAECQPMCVLRNQKKKIEVEIHPEESYPYLQFYTPDHRNSIAIENISGAPNAFNNGMGFKTLAAGESATFKTAFKIVLLEQDYE
ncbi:aldose 1-epimerase [soil metagenome]